MDMELCVKEAENQWHAFLVSNFSIYNDICKNKSGFKDPPKYSENGFEIDMSQEVLNNCVAILIQIPELYSRVIYPPNNTQRDFLLGLTAKCSQYESSFNILNQNNVLKTIFLMTDIKSPYTDPEHKLKCINLLCALFQHDSGLRWSLETNCWTDIFDLVLDCQKGSHSVVEGSNKTLTRLLHQTTKVAPKICLQVIKQMVQAPMNAALKNLPKTKLNPTPTSLDPKEYPALIQSVSCIVEVLENILSSPLTEILKYFLKLQVREACNTLSVLSNDEEFCLKLDRIMIILSFYEMTEIFDGIKVVNHDPIVLSGFLKIVEREMKKEHLEAILKLYYYAQKYWKNVSRKMPKYFIKEKPIDIEDELMSFQVEPMVIIAEKLLGMPANTEEDLRNCFLADLLNLNCVHCLQLAYEIRKHLPSQPLKIEIIALECLMKSKCLYSRKNLAIVFQVLIYSLRDFIKYLQKHETHGRFNQDDELADTLLQALLFYLENFDLSWRESIGSIELSKLVYEFLLYPIHWPAGVIEKALNVLNATISKHMCPQMALLVDTTQYTLIGELGSILFKKCFCENPQVRSAALNVVCTICKEANGGFTSFKKVILDARLPDLIISMSLSDTDPKVRATALKCLQEIMIMKGVGHTLLSKEFIEKMLGILSQNETMVVKEAIKLIETIYVKDENSEEDTLKIYNSMLNIALRHSSSEIQKHAVGFWDQVTKMLLEKEGMLDNEFPACIFSKEKKKIIRLDDKEIRKRLSKVLASMSNTGCCDVFQNILQNEKTTKDVFIVVVNIVTRLVKLLQQYEVTPEFVIFNQAYPNLWSIQSNIMSPSNQIDEDDRMQEIIEDTVLEMINDNDYFTNNKGFPLAAENNDAEKSPSQINRVGAVDFLDFLYRKLPYLSQDNLQNSGS